MKQYKVTVNKISSKHTNVREGAIEGITTQLPVVGDCFVLSAIPLIPGTDFRILHTTEIQNVEVMGNEYMFATLNSIYKLKIMDESV